MPLTMRADTTEYVKASFTTDRDTTSSAIEVALPLASQPPTTYYQAEVLGVQQVGQRWVTEYRILLGPVGGVTQLAVGTYDWTLKVTDNPEVAVRKVGPVIITAT